MPSILSHYLPPATPDLLPFSEESLSMVRGVSTESAAEMMASIRSLLE